MHSVSRPERNLEAINRRQTAEAGAGHKRPLANRSRTNLSRLAKDSHRTLLSQVADSRADHARATNPMRPPSLVRAPGRRTLEHVTWPRRPRTNVRKGLSRRTPEHVRSRRPSPHSISSAPVRATGRVVVQEMRVNLPLTGRQHGNAR